jgi:hypothetical protein
MFRFLSENKIIFFCKSKTNNDTINAVIAEYTEYREKNVLYRNNQKIIITDNFEIENHLKTEKDTEKNVKIFIIATLDIYIEFSKSNKKENIIIDVIFFPYGINFGFIKIIYEDYLLNNINHSNFNEFLNDCAHCKKNECILIHAKYKSYFRYITYVLFCPL